MQAVYEYKVVRGLWCYETMLVCRRKLRADTVFFRGTYGARLHGQRWMPQTLSSVQGRAVRVCHRCALLFRVERCVHVGGKHVVYQSFEQEIRVQNPVMHTDLHTGCVLPVIYSLDTTASGSVLLSLLYTWRFRRIPNNETVVVTISMAHCLVWSMSPRTLERRASGHHVLEDATIADSHTQSLLPDATVCFFSAYTPHEISNATNTERGECCF